MNARRMIEEPGRLMRAATPREALPASIAALDKFAIQSIDHRPGHGESAEFIAFRRDEWDAALAAQASSEAPEECGCTFNTGSQPDICTICHHREHGIQRCPVTRDGPLR